MPHYTYRKTLLRMQQVENPDTPDQWASPGEAQSAHAFADKIWYCEEVTEQNPIDNEPDPETGELIPMQVGNFCMWCNMGDHYQKRESPRDFFIPAYISLDQLPDQADTPFSLLP